MKKYITISAIVLMVVITGITSLRVRAASDTYYHYFNQSYSKFGYGSLMKVHAYSVVGPNCTTSYKNYNTSPVNTYVFSAHIFEYIKYSDNNIVLNYITNGSMQAVPPSPSGTNYIEEIMARNYNQESYFYVHKGSRYGVSNPSYATSYTLAETYNITIYQNT